MRDPIELKDPELQRLLTKAAKYYPEGDHRIFLQALADKACITRSSGFGGGEWSYVTKDNFVVFLRIMCREAYEQGLKDGQKQPTHDTTNEGNGREVGGETMAPPQGTIRDSDRK